MLAFTLDSRARSCIATKFGIAMAAKIPMITTTIISSISVKPLEFLNMGSDLLPGCDRPGPKIGSGEALEKELGATDMPDTQHRPKERHRLNFRRRRRPSQTVVTRPSCRMHGLGYPF